MPEFLDSYIKELSSKAERIKSDYDQEYSDFKELKREFKKFWVNFDLSNCSKLFRPVTAVDSSYTHMVTSNGGIFYVVRATALSKDEKYHDLVADFDFTSDSSYDAINIIHRKMEWLEHKAAIKAIKNGFNGFMLIDGSIYGRLSHIPIESGYTNDRSFLLQYFETVIELLELCNRKNLPLIGVSKESRTAFFREFLVKKVFEEFKDDISIDKHVDLLSLALDDKKRALEELENLEKKEDVGILRDIVEELLARRPDFQLILNCAQAAGYTAPLMVGASARWRRLYKTITKDPEHYVASHFPVSSREKGFVDWAVSILEKITQLPSIVSFHVLPSVNDTPMRIDIPAIYFGLEEKLSDVVWPEPVEVDTHNILRVLATGYCGLDNYNIWLKAVDEEVKLRRDAFENLYLPKFEEIVGRFATPRGYRRVRFP